MSDTPRTEAEVNRHKCWSDDLITIDANFACQLERELNAANDRIKRLEDGILKQNQEIEQTCGQVLGYPWFKDDQKNFPGATETDGVCVGDHVAETIVSELAKRHTEALTRIKRLEEESESRWMLAQSATGSCAEMSSRIKRLEEAGDAMAADDQCHPHLAEEWEKAKEATPSASRIVASVEEVIGGMGEDYAVVVLRSGHTLEVSGEGVVAWPSRAAQRRGDNSEVVGGISFGRKKEAKP